MQTNVFHFINLISDCLNYFYCDMSGKTFKLLLDLEMLYFVGSNIT